jgi:hypothetical protein
MPYKSAPAAFSPKKPPAKNAVLCAFLITLAHLFIKKFFDEEIIVTGCCCHAYAGNGARRPGKKAGQEQQRQFQV